MKERLSAVKDDRELVALTLSGHKEAFRFLVEKYQSRAYALANEILRSRQDAEDVVQEAFVKAYLSLASYRQEASFYTWLYRIIVNMAIDQRRKLSRRGADLNEQTNAEGESYEPVIQSAAQQAPDALMLRKEQAHQIEKTLGQLSEEHRAVFILREIDGLSYDEMAKVLGVTKGTVMSRLFYARKKLMEGLQDLRPAGAPAAESVGSAATEPETTSESNSSTMNFSSSFKSNL